MSQTYVSCTDLDTTIFSTNLVLLNKSSSLFNKEFTPLKGGRLFIIFDVEGVGGGVVVAESCRDDAL